MKAIILAAGRGSRFGTVTETIPKCMLEFAGKPILHHQLTTLAAAGITDVRIVTGYLADRIVAPQTVTYINSRFKTTNMVYSLFVAECDLSGDVLVTYADLVYDRHFLEEVLSSHSGDISVAVDTGWLAYYEARFIDPFSEAESLMMTSENRVLDIGRSRPIPDEVQGQYVGVVKLNDPGCRQFRSLYTDVKTHFNGEWRFRGRTAEGLYMTDFLQLLINTGVPVNAIPLNNGWIEFDSLSDYEKATLWLNTGKLGRFFSLTDADRGGTDGS